MSPGTPLRPGLNRGVAPGVPFSAAIKDTQTSRLICAPSDPLLFSRTISIHGGSCAVGERRGAVGSGSGLLVEYSVPALWASTCLVVFPIFCKTVQPRENGIKRPKKRMKMLIRRIKRG